MSCATVRKWVFQWKTPRRLVHKHCSRRWQKITPEMAEFMERKMEDDKITSAELHRLIARNFPPKLVHPQYKGSLERTGSGKLCEPGLAQ